MRLEGEILILKGGIKLGIVEPRTEYCVSYYEELVAKLKELLTKERQLDSELERLYVRRKLLSYDNVSRHYPTDEIDNVEASIEKIMQEDKTNEALIERYQAEIKRLVVLIPIELREKLEQIPTR